MKSVSRKRQVSSCISCYTKKQKCSRDFPCSHCTRRGRPHECVYYSPQGGSSAVTQIRPTATEEEPSFEGHRAAGNKAYPVTTTSPAGWSEYKTAPQSDQGGTVNSSSLVERFGYFEDSHMNTLALIRKFTGEEELRQNEHDGPIIGEGVADEVKRNIERMPDRPILDFLVQYFVSDVNWIDSLVDEGWFLAQYQRWWSLERVVHTAVVDFAVLILRMCSYASQFIPSPRYTVDQIRGVPLADIRKSCDEVAEELAAIGSRYDSRSSLVRVQHVCFLGLRLQCEGNMRLSWETLSHAVRVAQGLGIGRNANAVPGPGLSGELERKMRGKILCSLYVWDSMLARQLDRAPFLPDGLGAHNWSQIHLQADPADGVQTQGEYPVNEPDAFTERLLQARLASFWRKCNRQHDDGEYDVMAAEDRYECFFKEFITELPPAFAVLGEPNKSWDRRLPKLALQRQQLHIAIFDSICYNFRPLLLMQDAQLQKLPVYKRVVLASQGRTLAAAALCVLDRVKLMHTMLGCSHSRFVWLVFPTFEAGVLLASILSCADMRYTPDEPPSTTSPTKVSGDPIRASVDSLSRTVCLAAAHNALGLLDMLAEVSSMAEAGAQALSRLLDRATETEKQEPEKTSEGPAQSVPSKGVEVSSSWPNLELLEPPLTAEFDAPTTASQEFQWDALANNFSY
ncbi:hypothetical protein GGR54DRAFT_611903 [Hypoxylon sp. NC1633]|nr:hypothetical protein GGR54DRAFT_611903 [Hypoxylon sp. NC1633]